MKTRKCNGLSSALLKGSALALLLASIAILTCNGSQRKARFPAVIKAKVAGAEPVKTENCLMCHEDILKKLIDAGGVHAIILSKVSGEGYCESCHGNGSRHMESNDPRDIFGKEDMKKLTSRDKSAVCLACHETMKSEWTASPHNGDEVSCWDCHGDAIHGQPEVFGIDVKPVESFLAEGSSGFCTQCHEDVGMQFHLQYHHPVPGGGVDCTSCHAVHGEYGKVETGGVQEEVCLLCHTQVAGPWVFEHEALRDGCQVCHEPHGSVNRKLLTMDNNVLCLQCHFQTGYPMVNGMNHESFIGAGATCWQCHFEVHGSNSSPTLSPGL